MSDLYAASSNGEGGAIDPCADEIEQLDDDFDDDNTSMVRAKWSMDGAATLSEAASMLRGFAEHLEQLEREGWQLTEPVNDDYGFIARDPDAPGVALSS